MIYTHYIFNTLRILKRINPGDTYYEEYLKHLAREGSKFFDHYHLAVQTVIEKKPRTILEIGVRTGICICNMLSVYIDYSGLDRVVLIDLWDDGFASENIVRRNLTALNIPQAKIEFIKGDSLAEVPKLRGQFDWILVDGCHVSNVAAKDLENCVSLCADRGIIVFDDISEHGCNLKSVWDDFKAKHRSGFIFNENLHGKGIGWAEKFLERAC